MLKFSNLAVIEDWYLRTFPLIRLPLLHYVGCHTPCTVTTTFESWRWCSLFLLFLLFVSNQNQGCLYLGKDLHYQREETDYCYYYLSCILFGLLSKGLCSCWCLNLEQFPMQISFFVGHCSYSLVDNLLMEYFFHSLCRSSLHRPLTICCQLILFSK